MTSLLPQKNLRMYDTERKLYENGFPFNMLSVKNLYMLQCPKTKA
jgi:hypothetical protein